MTGRALEPRARAVVAWWGWSQVSSEIQNAYLYGVGADKLLHRAGQGADIGSNDTTNGTLSNATTGIHGSHIHTWADHFLLALVALTVQVPVFVALLLLVGKLNSVNLVAVFQTNLAHEAHKEGRARRITRHTHGANFGFLDFRDTA